MHNPHQVTKDFEAALCEYTGAPYAVAVSSCTMALLLAVAWHLREHNKRVRASQMWDCDYPGAVERTPLIEIPKRTYVGVPMSIIHAGGRPTFRDDEWVGAYRLNPLPVWDSARWFTSRMYTGAPMRVDGNIWATGRQIDRVTNYAGAMLCVSFHWSKTLGIQQGGAILHDDPEADRWLRRARFDGRQEGVAPKDDTFPQLGWHCYMSPEVAAEGLVRLSFLPKHNDPLPNDDYHDLSALEIFR